MNNKRNSSRPMHSQRVDMLSPHSEQSKCFFSSMLVAENVID